MTTTTATTGALTGVPSARRRRVQGIGYLAAGWAAAYLTVALIWTVTGEGFPFGTGNPDSFGMLRNVPERIGAPVFAGALLVTTVLMLVMAGRFRPAGTLLRRTLLGLGWLLALALLVVVPDPGVLALVGYAPLLLVSAPFGWPEVNYAEVFTWPLLNQVFAMLGGFLVAAAVLAWQRRTRAAGQPAGWTAPAAAARWGRWATAVAVAAPLVYATTRYAWLLGIPLMGSEELVRDLHADGSVWAGAWLGTFAVFGAILTLGLVRPWGERFPRWLVGLAGRPVPVRLAVVPALVVSGLVASAGLGLVSNKTEFSVGFWFYLPQLLWPVWGVALAAAAYAYHLRRTGSSTPVPPAEGSLPPRDHEIGS